MVLRRPGACIAFAALAFSLFGYWITVTKAWSDSHVASGYLPRDLTEFVADCGLRGNLYNPYGLGGYCIYRLYPNCRVFLNGRDHVYHRADPVVFADSKIIQIGSPAAANVLKRINIDNVLVPNGAFARSPHQSSTERVLIELERTPPTRQRPPRGWPCAFINREGALFVREDSAQWDACVRHMASYGITLDSSEGFDPQSVLESSPDFAFEYGMIDDLAAATLREPPASAPRQSVPGLICVAEALRTLTCARGAKAYLKRAR